MQPVLTVLKESDARRRYKPPALPYHLFYYTGFVNTFTENGRTFYPYPPLRDTSFPWKGQGAQRGGVGFLFCGEAASPLPSPRGKGVISGIAVFSYRSLPPCGNAIKLRKSLAT